MKTSAEIRRDNLTTAVEILGSAASLSDKCNVSSAYLSQIKNQTPESKTGKPKAMGDDVARKIETGLGKPLGWMDTDHSTGQLSPSELPPDHDQRIVSPEDMAHLVKLFIEANRHGRQVILEAAECAPKILQRRQQ